MSAEQLFWIVGALFMLMVVSVITEEFKCRKGEEEE